MLHAHERPPHVGRALGAATPARATADARPPGATPRRLAAARAISLVAVVLFLSADLKVTVHGYVHWAVAVVFLAALAFHGLSRFRLSLWHGFWATQFILAVAAAGLRADCGPYSAVQALKLVGLLLVGLNVFLSVPGAAWGAQHALVVSCVLNFLLLVGGLLISPMLAKQEAVGRFGTLLNWPGSLWKAGIVVVVLSLYWLVRVRRHRAWSVALLAAGLVVLGLDGSRTALLLLVAAFGFTATVLWAERFGGGRALQVYCVGGAVVMLGIARLQFVGVPAEAVGGLGRVQQLAIAVVEGGGVSQADPGRAEMVAEARRQVEASPVWGRCIGATTVLTAVGPMPVHMTYLQVWADLGFWGIAAYLGLVLGWVLALPRLWHVILAEPRPERRAVHYNAIFLLVVFVASGLFHPLSTEWSEWMVYIVPTALLTRLLRRARRPALETAHV